MNNIMNEKYARSNQQQNNEAGEWISELEDRTVEITATKQNKNKRMKRNEDNLRDFWKNMKCTNIHVTVFHKGKEREGGIWTKLLIVAVCEGIAWDNRSHSLSLLGIFLMFTFYM